ncbi:MAG: phosphate ABC transporter substrate-binding protein [Deltaproteobacteria bacterium]|nr:phosphate ABC transporter substrate-binding protein [Deltaproteobacteria bacterium]
MKRLSRFVLSLLLCFATIGAGVSHAAENVTVNGSTTVLPVAQASAEAFMKMNPGVNISISGGGSGNGIKALIDKSTDIANASRFIKDSEVKQAIEKGVYPVPHRIAIDCIVPIVHPSNPISGLSIEQMSLIYQGKIANWKEVGGPNMTIVVVSRDTSSGTYEIWEERILHKQKVTPKAQLQASNGAVNQTVSKNKYAIGYIGLGYLNSEVKGLKVNGIEASADTALSGVYPIARPLFMFTNGWPSGLTAKYINFIVSPKGQEIMKDEGFVPIY